MHVWALFRDSIWPFLGFGISIVVAVVIYRLQRPGWTQQRLEDAKNEKSDIEPQKVKWGVLDSREPGIVIVDHPGQFVPWAELKEEVEKKLLTQVRAVPTGSIVTVEDLGDRPSYVVTIYNPDGKPIGRVWFGTDASNDWRFDGLVRIGSIAWADPSPVWQIFQRYSDGTYERIRVENRPIVA
jgi:hypothetical protein